MSYVNDLKEANISYLGGVKHSAKITKSYKHNVMTYCVYLAPSIMSGFNVCPKSDMCRSACLNGSGRNKGDIINRGVEHSTINVSRIKKTRLFFENRPLFMRIMVHEMEKYQRRAEKLGMQFAVRINGTSDLSPTIFKDENGVNLLDKFSDVHFYDYTKVPNRMNIAQSHKNYYIVFSFDGSNWNDCEKWLSMGGNVAVVFRNEKKLPKAYKGYKVIDGNNDDARFLDEGKGVIVGLHYHRTANDYKMVNGRRSFVEPNTPFIVKDCECEW